jgi:3-hydroxybutyryl-CoA dehydrogenase
VTGPVTGLAAGQINGRVAVIGAGLMGSGIAQVAAQAGYDVVLHDMSRESLDRAMTAIEASQLRFAAKGTLTEADAKTARAKIVTTTDLGDIAGAQIVVEAVFEKLEVKQDVFRELDRLADADAVLATNTTAIPITKIAAATARPDRVVGTHFFSPVPMMALCELVRGDETSDDTLARARAFAEAVGKTCVVVERDIAGFVTSRLLIAFVNEAMALVESGVATPADIDTACRLGFGHVMGPLATVDLTGLDVILHAARAIYTETGDEKFAPPALLERMVAAGTLGRKTGHGFYDYEVRPA